MATARQDGATEAHEPTDAELLGGDEVSARSITLTAEERGTLLGIDASIESAREQQRRLRARLAALARQREATVTAIKASRYDRMMDDYVRSQRERQGASE